MKKLLYPLGVLAAALAMFSATATPALAHPMDWYFPGPGAHVWINSAHTRIGIEDTRCDDRWVRLDIMAGGVWYPAFLLDSNDCLPGGDVRPVPSGSVLQQFRVCAEGQGCTASIRVT
jgi:hypothetical protein